jgi:hypothetical protein
MVDKYKYLYYKYKHKYTHLKNAFSNEMYAQLGSGKEGALPVTASLVYNQPLPGAPVCRDNAGKVIPCPVAAAAANKPVLQASPPGMVKQKSFG